MSSILDALKKVEQESTMDRGVDTPWTPPLPAPSPYRQRTHRWWVPLGIVVGLCLAGVGFWQTRGGDTTPPGALISAAPLSQKPNAKLPPSVTDVATPNVPVTQPKQARLAKVLIDASPRQAASLVQPISPSVQTEKKPPRIAKPAAAPMVQPFPLPTEKTPLQTAIPTPDPVAAPPEDPNRHPADATEATSQPTAAPRDSGILFRSDPRIDLQALVWAPDAAARFVVINNRLVKEGGSVDNIVVVKINPDDVLLAEGSDRWHEAFNIR